MTISADAIERGATYLGIEVGSTRIKAALIDEFGTVVGSGTHAWASEYVDDNWTYSLDTLWTGIRSCYESLLSDVSKRWDARLTKVAGIGVSAMMHGYLAFDSDDQLLTPFRTWRNTYTEDASSFLSSRFGQNIPLRWSISHLLHAVLGGEEHVDRIASMTTLAGYVHWRLSGRKVLGIGDASGMFPIDSSTRDYDRTMLESFAGLDEVKGLGWSLRELLPEVLLAGEVGGELTAEGAALIDPTGTLEPGAVMAPPEGDAGTGMVATNSIEPRTGNVSAGTSAFAMVVLEAELSSPRKEIDLVTTPAGDPVAMIHTNNCTGDLDAWLRIFAEFAELTGSPMRAEDLYRELFTQGRHGDADAGGLLNYNYLSGEHQTGVASGRPLFVRGQQSRFTLQNFMRAQLYGAFGAMAAGMEVLLEEEKVRLDSMFAHGGIFRTQGVAQQVLADAINTPIAVGDSAGEGGSWGMAVLAAFTVRTAGGGGVQSLNEYLNSHVFAELELVSADPDPVGVEGYKEWRQHYRAGLPVERLAGEVLD
ncbi:xylulokinase [Crystallibacter crystallopoietes]|nr:FGGY-family carbohydrate kinase [Arthrobacter crystallopoietes]